MRPAVLAWMAGSIILVAAAAGIASPQFVSTFAGTYTSQTPGSPSGLDALASWGDPGEPEGKPKEIRRMKVIFPPGTKLDTTALPTCKASDVDVQVMAVRACPAKTKLGEVRGQGVYAGGPPFNTFATLFNARREIIVVVTLDNDRGRLLTNFRDDVRRSSITINLKIGQGISLIRFHAHVPRHFRRRGGKRRAYFRTPRTCPTSGAWTTTVVFSYRDGSSEQHSAPTPCRG